MKVKKSLIFMLLIVVVVAVIAQVGKQPISVETWSLTHMNRAAERVNLGHMLKDINDLLRGEKILVSDPTLSAGTGASDTTKIKHAAFKAWNAGSYISFSALATAFTATTHDVDSSKYATFRVGKDFDDSLAVIIMSAASYSTRDSALAAIPACPDSLLNLGFVEIYASGGAFDATTTKLNASTITVAYNDTTNYIIDLGEGI